MSADVTKQRGFHLPLSISRRFVCDLLHFARRIPTVPVQRQFDLHRLRELRDRSETKIGWVTLFTKAYGIVANEMPELRRAYLSFPFQRLYQHPFSVASVAVERSYQDENGVFFARLINPSHLTLVELETAIRQYKTAPVAEIFRFTLTFARLPRLLRRLTWWYLLNVRGSRKAQFMGTFGVTVYSSLGAESLHPLSPLTTTLNYGVIGKDGSVPVRLVYDHRVMDGATVARALARLEEVMNTTIADDMQNLISLPVPGLKSEPAEIADRVLV